MIRNRMLRIADVLGAVCILVALVQFNLNREIPPWLIAMGFLTLSVTAMVEAFTPQPGQTTRDMFNYKLVLGNTSIGLLGMLFYFRSWTNWQMFMVAYTIGTLVSVLFAWFRQISMFRYFTALQSVKIIGVFLGYYVAILFF